MDTPTLNPDVQEALATVQRYLADTAPPLEAADSITILLSQPPRLLASEIANWTAAQHQDRADEGPISHHLFHAVKKIHAMGELQLVPEASLREYLEKLKQAIMEYCPQEQCGVLLQNLSLLGQMETAFAPTGLIHMPADTPTREWTGSEVVQHERRFALLLERLEKLPPPLQDGLPSTMEAGNELVAQVLVSAAGNAQNDAELRQVQERLGSFGVKAQTDQIFRTLAHSLPEWGLIPLEEASSGVDLLSSNPLLGAMGQIIQLAKNTGEGAKRFQGLVESAVDQFNRGSLARAVAMFELAESVAARGWVEARALACIRESSHRALESGRLRAFAQNTRDHPSLRRILNFFCELRPKGLLEKSALEDRRERRRLFLTLLEVHGSAARAEILQRLAEVVSRGAHLESWFFARNLVYLLQRIPRRDDGSLDQEIALMARLLDPALPVKLVRDAITALAQIKQPKAEELLIALLQKLEQLLLRPGVSAQEQAKLKSILDRLVFALARYGTREACRAVTFHGLERQPELGETLERLAYLAAQDLSCDEECVTQIIAALRDAMPRGIFRAVVQKDVRNLMHFIKALSSTPAPAVREVFREMADRFPDQEVGLAAAKALREFDAAARPAESPGGRLLGNLEHFGLPDLLRQLAHSRATGNLTLQDLRGNTVGVLCLENGRLRSCRAAHLTADDGVYHLLEKPIQGTFAFLGQGEAGPAIEPEGASARELVPIIREGIRRYDEYQTARALAPDGVSLKPVGGKPAVRPEDGDPKFIEALWSKASAGVPPEECEAGFAADPLRIRRLLARWVEDGLLVPA